MSQCNAALIFLSLWCWIVKS